MNIETKTRYISGIINAPANKDINTLFNSLNDYCERIGCLYANILHDKDFNEDGVNKLPHIHYVITLDNTPRIKKSINDMSFALGISTDCITMSKTISVNGALQYLIHKNSPNKYQYSINDIRTNYDYDTLCNCLQSNSNISLDTLIDICYHSSNLLSVIKSVGLNYYHMYRPLIKDIYDEVQRNKINSFDK